MKQNFEFEFKQFLFYRYLTSFELLKLPFTPELWITLILTVTIGTFCFKLCDYLVEECNFKMRYFKDSSISSIGLKIFGILVLQAVGLKQKASAVSIGLIGYLILGLVVSTAYSGGLASVMNMLL